MKERSHNSLESNPTSVKSPEEGGDHEQKSSELEEKQERKGNWIKHCSHKHKLLEAFSHSKFNCQICKHKGDGMRYRCDKCNFHIHTGCRSLQNSLFSFIHHPNHELFLEQMPNCHLSKCFLCGGTIKGMAYRCQVEGCKFLLHPTCSQLHELLEDQPSHPPHPLRLCHLPPKKCDVCEKKCKHWRYRCDICDAHIHVGCMDRIGSSPTADHGGGKDRDRKCSGRACFSCLMVVVRVARAVFCVSVICGF